MSDQMRDELGADSYPFANITSVGAFGSRLRPALPGHDPRLTLKRVAGLAYLRVPATGIQRVAGTLAAI